MKEVKSSDLGLKSTHALSLYVSRTGSPISAFERNTNLVHLPASTTKVAVLDALYKSTKVNLDEQVTSMFIFIFLFNSI